MREIKINVNRQMDGYTFSISPSIRQFIKQHFPNSHPANKIYVDYDTRSNFEAQIGILENYIFPALLGIDNEEDLKQIGRIDFIDTQTGNIIGTVNND